MQLKSTDHFFEEFPHQNTVAPDHYLVEDLALIPYQFKRFFQSHIHEHVHSDHDPLDFPSTVQFDAELLGHVLVQVRRVALLGQWSLGSRSWRH